MGRAIAILSGSAAGRSFNHIGRAVTRLWQEMMRDAVRGYRPERHYMRGPGPAWRAKHGLQ